MNRRNIKNTFRDFLTFTRGERNGIIVLFFLIILTVIFRLVFPFQQVKTILKVPNSNQKSFDTSTFPHKNGYNNQLVINSKKRKTFTDFQKNTYSKKKYSTIELNQADSVMLESLPGIGKVLSGRIIKYRELLGGFNNKTQLNEVYGLKPDIYQLIQQYIKVDSSLIKKISINTATFKEINAHPYISYEQTKNIFKIRNRGIVITEDFMVKNSLFEAEEIKKLLPYLNFNN